MNKAKLKSYAPQARKDFIAAVEARANLLGLSETNGQLDITPSEKKGDVALIGGQAWPAKVHEQRERLIKRIRKEGYAHTLEAVACTWFNRFAALRYMEIHDYLGHGYRVLSSREGGLPEILTHATDVAGALPGLNASQVADMKLAGNQDGELYRLLLVAQFNALSKAMPFLFERIEDESELLLPGNLERTDSVVAKLVEAIPEEDWNEVEIIGWLYQFYISEKKDEVIGKVVKSEDIPAATQLFTPNWIVQYLVQNSVGRLWLMANPSSTLKSQWPYYIEPAEQTPEVQAQLDALIKTRMDEDGGSLNPETITVLDPACGSGHILVEAYEVLKGIYLERGYPARSIPRLILEKNLYGLDIDDRAAQLAGFALMMKARADDRRLLETPVKLNVLPFQESAGMDLDEFVGHLIPHGINRTVLGLLLDTFTRAKTFGSLIQIPEVLEDGLTGLEDGNAKAIENGDVFAKAAALDLAPLVQQAKILVMKFDAVVANPPYMGSKGMNAALREYAKTKFPDAKSDIFGMFIDRCSLLPKRGGIVSMTTMQSWMFLSSYSLLRAKIFEKSSLIQMFHTGPGLFPDVGAFNVLTTNFALLNTGKEINLKTKFIKANDTPNIQDKIALISNASAHISIALEDLKLVPEFPIVYWLSYSAVSNFNKLKLLGEICHPRQGMATGDNAKFVRSWQEIGFDEIMFNATDIGNFHLAQKKYAPYNKGGMYRKWYGNNESVLRFDKESYDKLSMMGNFLPSKNLYFREGIVYAKFGFENFGVRYKNKGFVFDSSDASIFPENDLEVILAFLCSNVAFYYLRALAPTVNFQVGDLARLPLPILDSEEKTEVKNLAISNINICKSDWDASEISWDFVKSPLLQFESTNFEYACIEYLNICVTQRNLLRENEETINKIFIRKYAVSEDVDWAVNDRDLTVKQRALPELIEAFFSYALGCMMGRYSLDELGLIYAHAGNVGFDATRYKTFPADADGIIPITDELWFEDDAANRIREFLLAVWPAETLDENMAWLAESLGTKGNETPAETIRRYLASSFFKDHLQTYKKRPIYWLFSSGKQGAFQALVYLHRYHEGTLSRMRAEYVVPLTGKIQSRIEMLEKGTETASTAARNKLNKEIEKLRKKHVELLAYDEKLRHYADMRISLDLDEGVKVNYGKFGDLLAEVKAVTGGAGDD